LDNISEAIPGQRSHTETWIIPSDQARHAQSSDAPPVAYRPLTLPLNSLSTSCTAAVTSPLEVSLLACSVSCACVGSLHWRV